MNFLLNQYSFIVISTFLTVVAGFLLLKNKPKWKNFLAFGIIITGLFFVKFKLRHLAEEYKSLEVEEFEEGEFPRKLYRITMRK